MKTLLLLLLALAVALIIWGAGIGVSFVIGGIVTVLFHMSDGGLTLFTLGSLAWTVYLAAKIIGGLMRAYRS